MTINNNVKIGAFALITLVVAALGYNYLKGRAFYGNNRTYYGLYTDASGINEGSFVKLHGVKVGSVAKVSLSKKDPTKVEVELNITNKELFIPDDSKLSLSADGLFTKALVITPGSSKTGIAEGSFFTTLEEKDLINKLSGKADPIMDSAQMVINNLDGTISTIDKTVGNINSVIDAKTKASVQNAVSGLDKSVADFNLLSASLAAQRTKIAATITSLETFAANLNKNNTAINNSLANVETTTKKLSEADITGTIAGLKNTLNQLNTTIEKVNSNQGTAGMLINDKKLYNDLQGSLHSLDALLADLKAHPGRYLSFSLIGRKQKELEVVTPK